MSFRSIVFTLLLLHNRTLTINKQATRNNYGKSCHNKVNNNKLFYNSHNITSAIWLV